MSKKNPDFLIIGAGIIGLTLAEELITRQPNAQIIIIDKEEKIGEHASGRNSGVLHAGFYYPENSLKARFCREGNAAWKQFCERENLSLNKCGKLVIASKESDIDQLRLLESRGKANGAEVELISEQAAREIEPNVKTTGFALYSPSTATVSPVEILQRMKSQLVRSGVQLLFGTKYLKKQKQAVLTTSGTFSAKQVINCAGLYADKIAHDFGFSKHYTMLPFKGLYLKYTKDKEAVRTNLYPVPDLSLPFLGVHFTKTVDGSIKIGPTAIPAFWREQYRGFQNFSAKEAFDILRWESQLFLKNSFHFRDLAFQEIRKYVKSHFVKLAQGMVKDIDPRGFTEWTAPGVRAQLLDIRSGELVQDFLLEGDEHSLHVLNAVSPAFTCSLPFAKFLADRVMNS